MIDLAFARWFGEQELTVNDIKKSAAPWLSVEWWMQAVVHESFSSLKSERVELCVWGQHKNTRD